jgi:hypothetical protein
VNAALAWMALIALTLASGWVDALGISHAARIHDGTRIVWPEVVRAVLWFLGGIGLYLVAVGLTHVAAKVPAEVLAMLWFVSTIVGVATLSGRLFQWSRADQAVALSVVLGLGWLLVRTGD